MNTYFLHVYLLMTIFKKSLVIKPTTLIIICKKSFNPLAFSLRLTKKLYPNSETVNRLYHPTLCLQRFLFECFQKEFLSIIHLKLIVASLVSRDVHRTVDQIPIHLIYLILQNLLRFNSVFIQSFLNQTKLDANNFTNLFSSKWSKHDDFIYPI